MARIRKAHYVGSRRITILREGGRRLLQEALELEVQQYIERFQQLQTILGDGVVGLSAHNVVRLKQVWEQEFQAWSKRDLHGKRYVYLWADAGYFNVRLQKDRPCVLVVVGVTEDGHKELLAIQDGERESYLSWLHPLQAVEAVAYVDLDGEEQTLAAANHRVDAAGQCGVIEPVEDLRMASHAGTAGRCCRPLSHRLARRRRPNLPPPRPSRSGSSPASPASTSSAKPSPHDPSPGCHGISSTGSSIPGAWSKSASMPAGRYRHPRPVRQRHPHLVRRSSFPAAM